MKISLENGYGREAELNLKHIFANFYDLQNFPTYEEADEMIKVNADYFDNSVYRQRIQISAETFLIEANYRGQKEGRDVHAFIVGLGLGVWKYTSEQVTRGP